MCENTIWQAPVWLTNSYLERVLQKYLKNDQVKIRNVDFEPATSNGENYSSIMTRIKVQIYSNKQDAQELSFIMKYSYESDPAIARMMSAYNVYNTEMKMYDQVLPQLAEILRGVGDSDKLFACTLKVDYERSAILFEDLTVDNYILADRLVGMNEVHARLALKKLAKFHAASLVLNQRLNGELENFKHGLFNRYTRTFGCFFEYMIEHCAKYAETCPELGAYYHDKLMQLKPYVVEYGTKAYHSNSNKFYTLTHGDFWINNTMMQYDGGQRLKDILVIDFQLCSWSSPAVDLHYFLNTSLETKLQLDATALVRLIQHYHKVLNETLKSLKYIGYVPTLHEFHVQMEEGKFLALTTTIASQAIMINDTANDANIHSLVDDDERSRTFRASAYKNERFQTIIKSALPYFDRHGLLDIQK